jgi:Cd2+/Zn2+-exporting ATPase
MSEQAEELHHHDHSDGHDHDHGGHHHHDHGHAVVNLWVAFLGGILIVNSVLAEWFVYESSPIAAELSAMLGALVLAVPILITAAKDIAKGNIFMNELVALALMAAFVLGQYQEAGIIAFFMIIAIMLEEKTAIGAKTSIEELIKLTPRKANRVAEGDKEIEVNVAELKVGDVVRVRPGENFPADGDVMTGNSTVNQASITGESLPVDVSEASAVFAGTENLTGSVDVKVTGVGSDTTLGKVRDLIEAAEQTRLPIMRLVDKYVIYYTPTILMISALVWFFTQDLMRVVFVLVIACPCAVVIATPSAVVAAIAAAARLGMLIKNVAHIETAAQIRAVIFDKTGTLTKGDLSVAKMHPAEGVELSDLLAIAVAVESQSNHPAAKAMRRLAEEADVDWTTPAESEEIPGKGVIATIDGKTCHAGRGTWFGELSMDIKALADGILESPEYTGMSIVYVAKDKKVLGWIGLSDTIRDEARETIHNLEELGVRHCCMVTGDNESVAKSVASKLSISEIRADCFPETKVEYVKQFTDRKIPVLVVGDGVNDAPALAAGDVSIAMGAIGSDVAINSASIALMNNDLRRVPFLISLSRKTRLIINLNLIIGIISIVGGMMIFIFGDDLLNSLASQLSMKESVLKAVLAASIHVLGTLVVVFNSARLVRFGEDLTDTPLDSSS